MMPLSEHERNLLELLEKQFKEEDPKFAQAMEQAPAQAPSRTALHIVFGATAVVAGFLLVLLGAAFQGLVPNILVGILGFAAMITGGYFAIAPSSGTESRTPAPASEKAESAESTKADRRRFRDRFGDVAMWSLFWWV